MEKSKEIVIMSDRSEFWNPNKIAITTESALIKLDGKEEGLFDLNSLKGKKVLLLVHGFDNTENTALQRYFAIEDQIAKYYDTIIGYAWPGYNKVTEYFDAEKNSKELANRMREHLEFLAKLNCRVDVLAHSMGNRLVLEALNREDDVKHNLVNNYYAIAAAVDDKSIEKGEKYFSATHCCNNIYVYYSEQDEVLKWMYRTAEGHKALGLHGAQHPLNLPKNVKLVDCTKIVAGHSLYFETPAFYTLFEQVLTPLTKPFYFGLSPQLGLILLPCLVAVLSLVLWMRKKRKVMEPKSI